MAMARFTLAGALWLAAYLAMLAAVVVTLLDVRRQSLATLDTPQARAQWDEWRKAAQREATGAGPVQRRVPKSSEPPALVLLRDYFGVCLAAAVTFSSLLFFVLMFTIRGAVGGARSARPGVTKIGE